MAYTANIPQPIDTKSASQPLMLANFQEISTLVSVDHVPFNDSSGNQGKHAKAAFPEQPSSPTTAANEIALFSRESAYSSQAELAVRKESSGSVYEFTAAGKATDGWTILPSGILMKWHQEAATWTGSNNLTYTWPTGANIPAFSAVYNTQLTVVQSGTADLAVDIRVRSATTTQLFIHLNNPTATNVGFYIYTIGAV